MDNRPISFEVFFDVIVYDSAMQ